MGLLQKLNSGVYDTPELSFKENQNIKSQENVSPIFINDFLISNDITGYNNPRSMVLVKIDT